MDDVNNLFVHHKLFLIDNLTIIMDQDLPSTNTNSLVICTHDWGHHLSIQMLHLHYC